MSEEFEFITECPKCKQIVTVRRIFSKAKCPYCGYKFESKMLTARKAFNPSLRRKENV